MTIAGLGILGGIPLYSLASTDAGNLLSAQGTGSSSSASILDTPTSFGDSSAPDIVNLSDAAQAWLSLPPNTVEFDQLSSISTEATGLASDTSTSSTDEYSTQSSSASAAFDISYNTPIATLESLGLIQQGDTLLGTGITTMTQQAQESVTQSATASQQTAAANDQTASSTATQSTQQAASEQNVAVFYTQNWMTPSGQTFIFQELVRVYQSADTTQAQSGASQSADALQEQNGVPTTAIPPINAVANAVANAPATPTSIQTIDNAETVTNTHAAAKSAATAQLATLSTQMMNSVMNSWLQLSNTASSTGSNDQLNPAATGATAPGTSAGQTTVANSTDQDAILKQTNSLLALFESLGASSSVASNAAVSTTLPAETHG